MKRLMIKERGNLSRLTNNSSEKALDVGGSGMLRGDVIERDNNVTHVRFKTWEIGDEAK